MAQGKNKKHRKGGAKKVTDPMSRKQWFRLKAPAPFSSQSFGYTCANRSSGKKKVEEAIKGRVVSYMQADLAPHQQTFDWRKIRLVVDHAEGSEAVTSFYGIDTTRDELCSLIKKKKTLIEGVQDCKSKDGYILRVFTIAFTKESPTQKKKTNYALSSQQKMIRKKMNQIIQKDVQESNVTQILQLFTSEKEENKIVKEVSNIYPVKNVKIRKIKVIQRPIVDKIKLTEMHDSEKRTLTKQQGMKDHPRKQRGTRAPTKQNQSENLVHK